MSIPVRRGDFISLSVRTTKAVSLRVTAIVFDHAIVNGKVTGLRYFPQLVSVNTTDASEVVTRLPGLIDGELLALNVESLTAGVQRGETWVVAGVSNQNHPDVVTTILIRGYVTSGSGLPYPGSPLEDSLSGVGLLTTQYTDNALASVLLVPANLVYEIEGIYVNSVVSAGESVTAGLSIVFDNNAGATFTLRKKTALYAGGEKANFIGFINASTETVSVESPAEKTELFTIPKSQLNSGWQITTTISGVVNYPNIIYVFRQWIAP